ncbi:unnamed protein product [Moneuplotes crassus]|uniref:Uncharacterized protein n=1 Tax=Euplotes crassus TaxID=5936 RepID=A0AAD2CXB5_EUPCR|nr:unnamed protein product [Moneuplotes crassus]
MVTYRQLWPIAGTSIFLNFVLMICLMAVTLKYWKRGIKEFYFGAIYCTVPHASIYHESCRALLYLYSSKKCHFNELKDEDNNYFRQYIVRLPIFLHGISMLSYLFRWISFCILAKRRYDDESVTPDIRAEMVQRNLKKLKVFYCVLIFVLAAFFIIIPLIHNGYIKFVLIETIVIDSFTGIMLLVVCNYFLHLLKEQLQILYEEKAMTIKILIWVISTSIFFRSASLLLDAIRQFSSEKDSNSTFNKINGVGLLACYYVETFPSIGVLIVLTLSYKQTKSMMPQGHNRGSNLDHIDTPLLIESDKPSKHYLHDSEHKMQSSNHQLLNSQTSSENPNSPDSKIQDPSSKNLTSMPSDFYIK